jgi:hypothetical protein
MPRFVREQLRPIRDQSIEFHSRRNIDGANGAFATFVSWNRP